MTVQNHPPALSRPPAPAKAAPPPLRDGQRLTQAEFHRRYEASEDLRVELIGGMVHMMSPMGRPHGNCCRELVLVVQHYAMETPGTEAGMSSTTILGGLSEPEPDIDLRILPEYGGRSRTGAAGYEDYLVGPPELVIEVADSTERKDLGPKKADYLTTGVQEYLVLLVRKRALRAFDLPGGTENRVDKDGIYRSRFFPGLWIEPAAILAADTKRSLAILKQGLAGKDHKAFVRQLKARYKRGQAGK